MMVSDMLCFVHETVNSSDAGKRKPTLGSENVCDSEVKREVLLQNTLRSIDDYPHMRKNHAWSLVS